MTSAGPAFAGLSLDAFTRRLASEEPTPGGGSASAVGGSLAAALLSMVAALSKGRSTYEPYVLTLERAGAVGEDARTTFLSLADADAAAYDGFTAARKMPKTTPEETEARRIALRRAARAATEVPLQIIRTARLVAVELEALAGRCNLNCASDLLVGSLLVEAAARGAAANVQVNLRFIGDPAYEADAIAESTDSLALIEDLTAQVREMVGGGRLREPEKV
ncbi:MAG: cyclodeaminase/cyclohydrolase family protein [Candidatus Limnocylindrales bacterium]